MGALNNVRFERFAQEIVKGTPVRKSYTLAGYRANPGNASRLRQHQDIQRRIAELQRQRTAAVELAQLSAAEKAGVSAFWVIRTLRRNSVLAARRGDTAASNRAIELIGKHIGLFVDRKEISINMIDDSDEYLKRIMELVQAPVIEHEQQPRQLAK